LNAAQDHVNDGGMDRVGSGFVDGIGDAILELFLVVHKKG
jgi:hypothetical protein